MPLTLTHADKVTVGMFCGKERPGPCPSSCLKQKLNQSGGSIDLASLKIGSVDHRRISLRCEAAGCNGYVTVGSHVVLGLIDCAACYDEDAGCSTGLQDGHGGHNQVDCNRCGGSAYQNLSTRGKIIS